MYGCLSFIYINSSLSLYSYKILAFELYAIFRDGVSESQFNQVLNIELEQIIQVPILLSKLYLILVLFALVNIKVLIQACKFLDESWNPKFLLVVAQKNHHTKIFQEKSPDNVPPGLSLVVALLTKTLVYLLNISFLCASGTVLDNGICHPRNNDFYLCAHAGMIVSSYMHVFLYLETSYIPRNIWLLNCLITDVQGTTRPTHYHVLYDELGYGPDDFQEFVLSLSYV